LQFGHWRHESTMHPTAATSPTFSFVTLLPTLITRPTISCPGTIGNIDPPHSSRAEWMSEWHTPQCVISIWTSRSPGSRREKVNGANGDVGLWTA
jgi:hypothetical protein